MKNKQKLFKIAGTTILLSTVFTQIAFASYKPYNFQTKDAASSSSAWSQAYTTYSTDAKNAQSVHSQLESAVSKFQKDLQVAEKAGDKTDVQTAYASFKQAYGITYPKNPSSYVSNAYQLYKQGNISGAVNALNTADGIVKQNIVLDTQRTNGVIQADNTLNQAFASYKPSNDTSSSSSAWSQAYATYSADAKNAQSVHSQLESAASKFQKDLQVAEKAGDTNDVKIAYASFKQAYGVTYPKNPSSYVSNAYQLYKQGNISGAVSALNTADGIVKQNITLDTQRTNGVIQADTTLNQSFASYQASHSTATQQ